MSSLSELVIENPTLAWLESLRDAVPHPGDRGACLP
jgi:hypothetical protein